MSKSPLEKIILFIMGIYSVSISAERINFALHKPTSPASYAGMVDGDLFKQVKFVVGGTFFIDLGSPQKLGSIIYTQSIAHAWSFNVTYYSSNDTINWKKIGSFIPWDPGLFGPILPIETTLDTVTARYVKVEGSQYAMWPEGVENNEIEIYGYGTTTPDLAKGKKASASFAADVPQVTDDSIWTGYDVSQVKTPAWVTVDLEKAVPINRVRLLSGPHTPIEDYSIAGSTDNINWTEVAAVNSQENKPVWDDQQFSTKNFRYIRCTFPKVLTSNSGEGSLLKQIQIYGPGDATTGIKSNPKTSHANFSKNYGNKQFNFLGRIFSNPGKK